MLGAALREAHEPVSVTRNSLLYPEVGDASQRALVLDHRVSPVVATEAEARVQDGRHVVAREGEQRILVNNGEVPRRVPGRVDGAQSPTRNLQQLPVVDQNIGAQRHGRGRLPHELQDLGVAVHRHSPAEEPDTLRVDVRAVGSQPIEGELLVSLQHERRSRRIPEPLGQAEVVVVEVRHDDRVHLVEAVSSSLDSRDQRGEVLVRP